MSYFSAAEQSAGGGWGSSEKQDPVPSESRVTVGYVLHQGVSIVIGRPIISSIFAENELF